MPAATTRCPPTGLIKEIIVRISNIRTPAIKYGLMALLLLLTLVMTGCGVSSTPQGGSGGTIAGGSIYICPSLQSSGSGFGCSQSSAPQGKVVAVNTADGTKLWQTSLQAPAPSSSFLSCSSSASGAVVYGNPAALDDLVYVADYNGKVYAISASTRLSKEIYLDVKNPQPIISAPVAASVAGKKLVLVASSDGKVYALDATSLERVWVFPTGGKIWATPVLAGDTIYVGSFDKKLYAINATDGSKKWEYATGGSIISSAALDGDTVYVASFDRNLHAVNTADGTLKWTFTAAKLFWSQPLVVNNKVYAACLDNKVYVLDAGTGNNITEFDLGSPISSSPVIVGKYIVFASEKGKISAIDTTSNQIKLLTDLSETVNAPLSGSGSIVYIYTHSQNLYALSVESGAKLWSQLIK
jgi:eukaryotic-like serine/threonine-protein kinase